MKHKITIKWKEFELSTDEAKKLFTELATVFAEKTPVIIKRDRLVPYPVFHQPPQPLYPNTPQWAPDVPYCQPSVTCRSN